jgi:hypothetical protein
VRLQKKRGETLSLFSTTKTAFAKEIGPKELGNPSPAGDDQKQSQASFTRGLAEKA